MKTIKFITRGRQANELISEIDMIREVILLYHEGKFEEMKGLILEYGEFDFFTDLYMTLEFEVFRSPVNKYLITTGIIRQFFKIYT